MELTRATGAVLRRVYLVILGALLIGALAYFWSMRQPTRYTANAQVVVALTNLASPETASAARVANAASLAQQYIANPLPSSVLDQIHEAIPGRTPAQIKAEVSFTLVAGQPLITITALDRDSATAQALANSASIAFAGYYSQQEFNARATITQQVSDLQAQFKQSAAQIKDLQQAIAAAKAQGADTTALQTQLTALQNQQASVTSQLTAAQAQADAPLPVLWLAQSARPAAQVSVNIPLNTGFGVAAGLLAGMGLALLLDLMDGIVRTPIDTSRFAALTTLATMRDIPSDDDEPALLAPQQYFSVFNSYQELAQSLLFLNATRRVETLMVAPADNVPNDDLVGIYLAITYALSGERTLLIDANWDSPSLEKRFGLPPETRGGLFTSVLAMTRDAAHIYDAIQPTEIPGLYVLLVGPQPPNPDDVMQPAPVDHFFTRLESQFSQIVVLAPAGLLSPAGRQLAERMDGTLVVAHAGSTVGGELAGLARSLRRMNCYLVGAALVGDEVAAKSMLPAPSQPAPAVPIVPAAVTGALNSAHSRTEQWTGSFEAITGMFPAVNLPAQSASGYSPQPISGPAPAPVPRQAPAPVPLSGQPMPGHTPLWPGPAHSEGSPPSTMDQQTGQSRP
ncbi:MAG: hypothetical protein OJF49_002865 [Ktedonobacterales bacterium]|jgi:capsular polysaccharide biosynthesis protein|nr:MAG: hypothetical protein OJF49_002865 [Ktedonobacterales bacterium]